MSSAPSAKVNSNASPPAETPPNPGPPGGANPADLAQAMMDEQRATHDVAANVKTVQAFDQMLDTLSRIVPPASDTSQGASSTSSS